MSRNIHEIIKNMPWWARLEPVAGLLEAAFLQGWYAGREVGRVSVHDEDVLRSAIKDLADAAAPIVADKPATTRDYVELHDARKRALRALEDTPNPSPSS
jgi:hypothetical protein